MKNTSFSIAFLLVCTLFITHTTQAQGWIQNANTKTITTNTGFNNTPPANVGIGIVAPGARLDILGGPDWSSNHWKKSLQINNGSAIDFRVSPTLSFGMGASSSNQTFTIFTTADGNTTPTTSRLAIKENGNVGIGTITPEYKLDVRGWASIGGSDFVLGRHDAQPQKVKLLNRALVHGPVDDDLVVNWDGNFEGGVIIGGPKLVVDGRVGIGTTSPGAKVHTIENVFNGNGGRFEANSGDFAYGVWGVSGIGYAGYFSGRVNISGTLTQNSDAILKENIQPITNALAAIQQIEPSTYTFKTREYAEMNLPTEKQYGFIAQNIERVFPEMVSNITDKSTEPAKEFKAVNYTAMIPVLAQGIREQQEQIQQQQTRNNEKDMELANAYALIEALSTRLSKLETALNITSDHQPTDTKTATVSAKISPNPTSGLVTLELQNTAAARTIIVKILDAAGHEVANSSVTAGTGSIQFDLSQFPAGVYVAQVVADGKMVSSSKVQLVK